MLPFVSRTVHALRTRKVHLLGTTVAVALAVNSAAWVTQSDSAARQPAGLETAPVVVSSMTRSVRGRGQLDAWKSTRLISKCYWDTRILSLVPEGTLVKKGDIICQLDATRPQEYALTRRIRLIGIQSELATAELQSKLVGIENRRRARAAERLFEDSKYALAEYRDGNEPLMRSELQRKAKLANDRREQAVFDRGVVEEMYLQGVATGFERNEQNLDLYTAEKEWREANSQATVHERYQAERTLFSLEGNLDQAEAGVDATTLRNELRLTQAEFAKLSDDRRFAHYTRYLGYALTSIEACTIRAPHDGRVLYANNWHRRSYGRSEIEEGAEVDYRQGIIDLPDYSRFVVKAWANAAEINNLAIGQPASATIGALGDRELSGTVAEIGRFPVVLNKYRDRIPKYSVTIEFNAEGNDLAGLSPRMDAVVDIRVMDRENVLQVPIETIVWSNEGSGVIVSDGISLERREVELGVTNDVDVEILDGLEEGEMLVVDPSDDILERLRRDAFRQENLAL